MKIVTVVGARPQFVKAAALSRVVAAHPEVVEVVVHTGQHYDEKMSGVFFTELGMRAPAYNLGIAGGSHGAMTGRMLEALEPVLVEERPDWLLVYGDTNSTLAAVLAASKLHIPIAHVEAGLRSFNMKMPEEVNRIVADRLSNALFCPTSTAVENLAKEGLTSGVHLVGDVMYDAALHFADLAMARAPTLLRALDVEPGGYVLATCHRAENVDVAANLREIVDGLIAASATLPVVFPLHPRTAGMIARLGLSLPSSVRVIEPVSYLEMVALEKHARLVVTDSGGVQKEAFFYRVPCVTTREETEWVETVTSGWNILAGASASRIVDAIDAHQRQRRRDDAPYGNGDACERILTVLSRASSSEALTG
jgi:UDP-GlcNAc3NAcA epimerase